MRVKLIIYDSILILLILSLVLVDWRINTYITFSDVFLILALFLLLIKGYVRLEKKQILNYFFVTIILLFNMVIQIYFNNEFEISKGLIGTVKVVFYFASVILFYNFIKIKKLEVRLLNFLYKAGIAVCIVGLYIYISITLNNIFPYEFLWRFTRSDMYSYTYGWFGNIIRMRSVFSEPAHLGFFLILVLSISTFNKQQYKLTKKSDLLITLSLILSFSFSSILILIVVKSLKLVQDKSFLKLNINKTGLISLPILIAVLIKTKDTFMITFINRIERMIQGIDTSASARLSGSWSFINPENILFGNGIGNTPTIFNNYAYIISDLGLLGILIFLAFNIRILKHNKYFFVIYILLNFMKGGYLGAGFWIFSLLFASYSFNSKKEDVNYLKI